MGFYFLETDPSRPQTTVFSDQGPTARPHVSVWRGGARRPRGHFQKPADDRLAVGGDDDGRASHLQHAEHGHQLVPIAAAV
eukprot:6753734-Pyramimonas_sp.AAC.1